MQRVCTILKDKRLALGMSLKELSTLTKISPENILLIEEGSWHKIASPAYTRGMVGKYAAALALDTKKILTLLKREIADDDVTFIPSSDYEVRREKTTVFSKNTMFVIFIFICLLFFVAQLVVFWQQPLLKLSPTPQKISAEEPLIIKGKTEQGVLLYLNDERLYQNDQGNFYQELYLKKGTRRHMTVKAIGQNGRTEKQIVTVEVK